MTNRLFLVLIAALTLGPAGLAQTNEDFVTSFNDCKKIQKAADRLQCFDGLEPAGNRNISQGSNKSEQEQDFGAQQIKARKRAAETASGSDSLTAEILEAGKNRAGQYFFIFKNSQVWRQLPSDDGRVRIPKSLDGVKVTIKRKSLGSHKLYLNGRSIKVKRIK